MYNVGETSHACGKISNTSTASRRPNEGNALLLLFWPGGQSAKEKSHRLHVVLDLSPFAFQGNFLQGVFQACGSNDLRNYHMFKHRIQACVRPRKSSHFCILVDPFRSALKATPSRFSTLPLHNQCLRLKQINKALLALQYSLSRYRRQPKQPNEFVSSSGPSHSEHF